MVWGVKYRSNFAIAFRIVFVAFLFYLVYEKFWHILFANIIVLMLLFLPFFVRKEESLRLPVEIECIFILFLIFSSFVGQFVPMLMQFLFGVTLGLVGFVAVFLFLFNKEQGVRLSFIVFFSFCVSLALASAAEIIKFYLKDILGYSFSSGDYLFAMSNLGFVLVGSIIANFCSFFYFKVLKGRGFGSIVRTIKAENPNFFITRSKILEDVKNSILNGEGERVEFKSSLRMNLHTMQPDHRVENSALKSLVSFMNTEGGFLFLGVSDSSDILGIEGDGFENVDLFNRHLTNLIKENIGAEFLPYLSFDFFKIDNKTILRINCMKSSRPVFLKEEGRDVFYIRVGASSILLSGNKMVDYIRNNKF